jgi:2-succinyl-6-hydroxy-2,4-cyclohexadiene-1-carboxylate synthase
VVAVSRALVLLHGFTQTGASWDRVRAALAARTEPTERYRPLAPDIRGHGEAGARRPVTLAVVTDDVLAAVPGPFALAGYSMGGRIALHVALAAPERVQRLVLVGGSPGLADRAERAARRRADEQLAADIERARIEEFARRWAETPVLAGLPPDVAAAVHADRLRSTPEGLAAALRGLGTGALPSLWDRLGELAMPITLIVGERDEKFRAIAADMAERLPDGRLEVVAGAGHAVHLEAPAVVAALIDTSR